MLKGRVAPSVLYFVHNCIHTYNVFALYMCQAWNGRNVLLLLLLCPVRSQRLLLHHAGDKGTVIVEFVEVIEECAEVPKVATNSFEVKNLKHHLHANKEMLLHIFPHFLKHDKFAQNPERICKRIAEIWDRKRIPDG